MASPSPLTPQSSARPQLWLAAPAELVHFCPEAASRRVDERVRSRALLERATHSTNRSFSLSHSGGHAAVLVGSAETQVGVDIEMVRSRDVIGLAEFSFSKAEVCDLRARSGHERIAHFYTLWTLKEAFAKALALELLVALECCRFRYANSGWQAEVPTEQPWIADVFRVTPDLIAAAVRVGGPGIDYSGEPEVLDASGRAAERCRRVAQLTSRAI